ncbi:uncharacterized protein LOC115683804 [Syzygium oleosum]|uniref:uncharacterized protein LOC115683804 n=1 Tax=Syzygium oleosum TaxID=219896 RepID=UPI0024B9731F|nr:uncharacterized protein LOC115683804 [Syzygium oleosum]
MKAFFLGGSGGTGVFLPCGTGHQSGCSTVLIPAGVAQALRLHFDRISSQFDPGAVGGFPMQPAIFLPKRISDGKSAKPRW